MVTVDEFSIFDEEVEEAGQDQEAEAFCVKCKADTSHTVVQRYDDEIRRVRCNICDDTHGFRPPRGEEEGIDGGATRKRPQKVKPTWDQVMGKHKKEIKAYNVNEIFSEMDVINHPIFGKGFVSELIGYDKIEVTFQHDRRILIHNRQKRPIPLPEYAKHPQEVLESEDRKSIDPLALHDDHDFEEMIDIGEDLLLGSSTKLSPKAWAALHAEDVEDDEAADPLEGVEEDYSDLDVADDSESDEDDDGDDDEPKKKKAKPSGKENKKKAAPKKTKAASESTPKKAKSSKKNAS